MTAAECRRQEWPHEHRCRYTSGFFCEDCLTFFATDSPDYLRYELPSTLGMVISNIAAVFHRAGQPVPENVRRLRDTLYRISFSDRRTTSDAEREAIVNEALIVAASYGKNENSADLTLR